MSRRHLIDIRKSLASALAHGAFLVHAANLVFPSELERRFQVFYSRRYRRQMRFGLCCCAAGLLLIPLFQALVFPQYVLALWPYRAVLTIACCLLVLLAYQPVFRRFHQSLMVAGAGLVTTYILLVSISIEPALRYSALSGLLVVLMLESSLLRLQFRVSAVFLAYFIIATATAFWVMRLEPQLLLSHSVWLLLGIIAALLNNWFGERYIRHNYVQLRLLEIEKAEVKLANAELQKLANRDALTGIGNRRHFDECLEQEWRRAQRQQSLISMLMIDVDFFKLYNDHYGHPAGDVCLHQLGQAINTTFNRSSDIVCRYGGEEFAVILPGLSREKACVKANELRQVVEQLQIVHQKSSVSPVVTVSIGVASLYALRDGSAKALIEQADQALYAAKHQGRNRVYSAEN